LAAELDFEFPFHGKLTDDVYYFLLTTRRLCMAAQCELLENCGFFNNFQGNSEVVKQGWINMFCKDKEKSEKCKRKEIRKQTGKPPADNMTPTGKML
jgi:hypothetical protein